MFLVAVGFWNFLGAGIFGFLINLPVVSYYEIGTALTANHGHAAMMGVYGMLAIGLALFCLRYLIPAERWPEKWARIAFWSTNIGLAWMCFATLLPLGIAQLYKSVNEGYWEARDLNFLTEDTNALLEWLRLPGDIVFIVGRRAARALHRLHRHPPHGQAGHARGARGHPVHRDRRSRGRDRSQLRRGRRGEGDMSAEALLAGAATRVALLLSAGGLEWLSAHTHRRSLRYRTAGFDYQRAHDVWVCPEGEHLWPHEFDHERRLVRYRARAHVCNGCPLKERCTDSDEGREIVRPLDPWPHSEAGRFHRVIALMLVALAALVAAVALARNLNLEDAGVLMGLVAACAVAFRYLLRDLRTHPANFPDPSPAPRDAHEETLMLIALTSDHYRHHDGQVDGDREQILEDRGQRPGAEGRVLAEALKRGGQRRRYQGRDRAAREHGERDCHGDL